ncbi:DUF2892 domain-containing protein [Spirochaetia bacterium 38H-sp]|uniref:DUF2892 domain-containing protein n=1 Tax=Rarispira pelagica TaxID=3141764 RepID=A0ABU9U9J8_9SPIR
MEKNVGKVDRIIRVILGIVLIVLGLVLQLSGQGFWWLALIGAVLLITGLVSFCGLYKIFGISTCKKE